MIDTVGIIRWAVRNKVRRAIKVGPDHTAKEWSRFRAAPPSRGNAAIFTASTPPANRGKCEMFLLNSDLDGGVPENIFGTIPRLRNTATRSRLYGNRCLIRKPRDVWPLRETFVPLRAADD